MSSRSRTCRATGCCGRRSIDPVDRVPPQRVYALDEATGTIRFGDGLHGAIPPIGVDSIVAFTYERTRAGGSGQRRRAGQFRGTAAHDAQSRLAGRERGVGHRRRPVPPAALPRKSTTAFCDSAPARLRHRGRAVTARDFEDLALPAVRRTSCRRAASRAAAASGWSS